MTQMQLAGNAGGMITWMFNSTIVHCLCPENARIHCAVLCLIFAVRKNLFAINMIAVHDAAQTLVPSSVQGQEEMLLAAGKNMAMWGGHCPP